mmetsp:Transcript_33003/g.97384  ORF Transcript_33003/g.97384 Transcript_33003/m.97384 type:complete len:280 (-) Transcript_33003:1754-2593(-)
MASTISKGRKRQRSSSAPLGCLISAYLIANSCPAPLAPTAVWAFSGKSPTSSAQHIVKICQNKDCRKRFSPRAPDGSLVDTIKDLLPSSSSDNTGNIAIESSGCLSQCGKGPNLCVVEADSGKERLFYGVDSASTAAAILDVACDYDPPVDLIMAADKISKAQIASSPAEKLSLVTPVIENLSSNEDYSSSRALSHALTIRADARLDSFPPIVDGAVEDSQQATAINPLNGRAWRVLADAEEAAGNIESAIGATVSWGEVDPSFATKAKNEVARLSKKV